MKKTKNGFLTVGMQLLIEVQKQRNLYFSIY